jgi:cytidylate kinase
MTQTHFRKTDFIARPQADTGRKTVIAVDGPAASGKGTLARRLAERLGYAYLDTGALYRAVGLAALEIGADLSRYEEVEPALAIVKRNLTPELLANPALRAPEVSDASSKVAALPEVRIALLEFQRGFAQNPPHGFGGAVLDGRDIGTVVCPDADIKFYITATAEERARRASGRDGGDAGQALAAIKARDLRDETRQHAPSRPAEDAYVIDTTALGVTGVLDEAIAVIRSKFLDATDAARD